MGTPAEKAALSYTLILRRFLAGIERLAANRCLLGANGHFRVPNGSNANAILHSRHALDYFVGPCSKIINLAWVPPGPQNRPSDPIEKAPYLSRNNSRTDPSKRLAP